MKGERDDDTVMNEMQDLIDLARFLLSSKTHSQKIQKLVDGFEGTIEYMKDYDREHDPDYESSDEDEEDEEDEDIDLTERGWPF